MIRADLYAKDLFLILNCVFAEATSFFESLELRCPVGYNQAEFYVSQLGVVVDDEQRSLEKVQRICDQFAESRYGEVLRQHVFDGAEETAESHSRRSSRDDEDLLKVRMLIIFTTRDVADDRLLDICGSEDFHNCRCGLLNLYDRLGLFLGKII